MGCLLAFLRVNASPVPEGFPLFPSPGAREGGSIGGRATSGVHAKDCVRREPHAIARGGGPARPIVEGSPIAHTIWCIQSIDVTHDCGLGCRACTVMIHKAQG